MGEPGAGDAGQNEVVGGQARAGAGVQPDRVARQRELEQPAGVGQVGQRLAPPDPNPAVEAGQPLEVATGHQGTEGDVGREHSASLRKPRAGGQYPPG